MHDARRHRALATIATIREAQRAIARQDLFAATEREHEAQAARDQAHETVKAAAAAWADHLGAGFHPELASALAGELVGRVQEAGAADDHAGRMTEGRESCEAEWRIGDARCRQADAALKGSRRDRMRDREERALETLADRISFRWSRR